MNKRRIDTQSYYQFGNQKMTTPNSLQVTISALVA